MPVLIGDPLPDAALPDVGGGHSSLVPIAGQAPSTILDLWASWCAPCRRNRNFCAPSGIAATTSKACKSSVSALDGGVEAGKSHRKRRGAF
ncbi:MAG: hypothetical protein R2788_20060 [Saprospiraceae bacterium]